jgi:DNA replication licensing factor MCM7
MHNITERQGHEMLEGNEMLPTETHKNYDVSLVNGSSAKNQIRSIHDLSAIDMGCLVTVKAIVLRATEVKPELVVATYTCDVCGG